jgi:hypothetical protein
MHRILLTLMMTISALGVSFGLAAGSLQAAAAQTPAKPAAAAPVAEKAPEIQRVGGDYKVASIDKVNDHAFQVLFTAVHPTGRFDNLRLESDHVHVAVKVGQTLRLSAEILTATGTAAEVSQVVLFLPGATGPMPVWMLSNKAPIGSLRAVKYLEMHDPLTDYMVM